LDEEENLKSINLKTLDFSQNTDPWELILASGSPRRKRILEALKLDFRIIKPATVTERYFKNPYNTVKYNSSNKAHFVYNHVIMNNLNYRNTIVAGFDTIVYFNGQYMGKPADKDEALYFLEKLSGNTHKVITGLAMLNSCTGELITDRETTLVKFREMSRAWIKHYVEVEDLHDKAGAYDISGTGSIFVERIKGCFYNVAGLPVFKFLNLLERFGLVIY
jgi:septum formation protein